MKRNISAFMILALLTLSLIAPVFALNFTAEMGSLPKDKVKLFELPMGKPSGQPSSPNLSVDITSPADGATLIQGTIAISAIASARTGIATVEIKINEGVYQPMVLTGTVYTYSWDANTADGTYVLTAKATDNKGKTATDTITVYFGETPPPPPPPTGKWAVVIGIADYEGRGNDLWHPDEDAKEMANVLYANGYATENVKVLLNRQATAQAIVNAINWLVESEAAGDEVVFFYSGHGSFIEDSNEWDNDGESDGYDEMIVSYDFYGLTDGSLKTAFATIESTKFALMFGSCNSGGMFDDDDDLQGAGRVIAAACKADQYGYDYLSLGNTLWGYHFVDRGLLNNEATSIEGAHAYAYKLVTAAQPDSQPQLYDNYDGDFAL